MKTPNPTQCKFILLSSVSLIGLWMTLPSALAASDTWSGGGAPDGSWSNTANWDNPPAAKDFLFFDNGSGTQPFTTNNLAGGTIFGNITFNGGTVSFTNSGNGIVLTNATQDPTTLALSGGGIT